MNQSLPCMCGSGKSYERCCARFLEHGLRARTPEQLMRSRYSAFAQGGKGEYLLSTWFPATAQGLSAVDLSIRQVEWLGLQVLNKSQTGDNGLVEFKAEFVKPETGVHKTMHERSVFKRVSGHWYYVGAEVTD